MLQKQHEFCFLGSLNQLTFSIFHMTYIERGFQLKRVSYIHSGTPKPNAALAMELDLDCFFLTRPAGLLSTNPGSRVHYFEKILQH